MARVLIAVPTFESITPDTFKAIWDMDKAGNDCDFEFVRGYDCAAARNRIAKRLMDGGHDLLLMVDSDVIVPRDALANLQSHDRECVSGFYLHRGPSNEPNGRTCACRLRKPDGELYYDYPLESEYTTEELAGMRERGEHLVEIHGGGMGCVLVRREVFERLKYPWFDWVDYDDGRTLSEDLFFCERLRKASIGRYLDTRVACGHIFKRVEGAI